MNTNNNSCDTYNYINTVNSEQLCGSNNWRIPTREELSSLIYCSDEKYSNLDEKSLTARMFGYIYICSSNSNFSKTTMSPTIGSIFNDMKKSNQWFWTSSSYTNHDYGAWGVDFSDGFNGISEKENGMTVRLVRNTK